MKTDHDTAPYVLALDTAMAGCNVALYDRGAGRVFVESTAMARGQAEVLVPMIQRVMTQAEQPLSAVHAIVTTVGPGAFAGLRIGLSTARALGLALSCPVYGVTTVTAIAAAFCEAEQPAPRRTLCVVLETKRADFYTQFFDENGAPDTAPTALSGADMAALIAQRGRDAPVMVVGDAALRLAREQSQIAALCTVRAGFDLPDPAVMARLPFSCLQAPDPVYLRGADVSQSKRKQRVIEK